MKRISFKIVLVSIVAIAIFYSVNQSKSKTELSELVLANVEALAQMEWGNHPGEWDPAPCSYHIYETCSYTYQCGFNLCFTTMKWAEYSR